MVVSSGSAWACHCMSSREPPCQAAWAADAVFVGRVLDIIDVEPDRSRVETLFNRRVVRLAIIESFRGTQGTIIEIRTGRGGGDCGFPFEAQQDYLIYAHLNGGALTAVTCSRTRLLKDAAEDLAYLRPLPRQAAALGRLIGVAIHHDFTAGRSDPLPSTPVPGVRVSASGEGVRLSGVTAVDGSYELRAPVGTYELRFEGPEGFHAPREPTSVTLRDARGCASADVYLRSNGIVSGAVVAWDGKPVSHLPIELVTPALGDTLWRTTTDEDGRYRFEGVSPGRYLIGVLPFIARRPESRDAELPRAFFPGTTVRAAALVVTVARAERVLLPPFVLPSTESFATLTGTAVDTDGRPVPDAYVFLNPDSGMDSIGEPVRTDGQGRFRLTVKLGLRYVVLVQGTVAGALARIEAPFGAQAAPLPALTLTLRPVR